MARIAGIITDLPPDDAEARLSSMIGAMVRKPGEVAEILCIPELRCYLGWVSQTDADADDDPMICQQNDKILLFSGEHFTDRGIITSNRPNGVGKDRSVGALLHSFGEGKTERAIRELNGWFAGIFVDLRTRNVVLFNDRFGLHRVYYTQATDAFSFASEAKALLTIRPETRQLNPETLAEFVTLGSVLQDRTLFQDVFSLPGASAWDIRSTTDIKKRHYFSADEWEGQPILPEAEFYARLKATISRVIPRYFGGERDVAVSLTGGVDTRVIMAFAEQNRPTALSYTFAGMYRDCFDVQIAREVAQSCGYQHQVLRLGPEFLANFSEYAEKTIWITDGTLDTRSTHEVYLHELARQIAPVRITGNYGSEIFRDARTLKPMSLSSEPFDPAFAPYVQEAGRSFASVQGRHPVSFAVFNEIPGHLFGRLSAAQSQLTLRSPYTDNDLVALAYQAPAMARRTSPLWNRLITEQDAGLASIPTDRGHVAGASPFSTLPNRFYNYLLFKAEWYYESGMPHWLARVDHRIPQNGRPPFFAGTHKIEHYRRWFRDQLFEYLYSVLGDSTTVATPWVNWNRAKDMLLAHRDGRGNYVQEINRLATISLIQKLLVKGPLPKAVRRHTSRVSVAPVTQ